MSKSKKPGPYIVSAKDGLLIGGQRYNAGQHIDKHHITHDVLQAADGKAGALRGWVKRTSQAPSKVEQHIEATEPVGQPAPEVEAATPEVGQGEPGEG